MKIARVLFQAVMAVTLIAGLFIGSAPGVVSAAAAVPDRVTVITTEADNLVANQNADGGFPWYVPAAGTSYKNIHGVTAMGILEAHGISGAESYETALAKAYDYALVNVPVYTWNGTTYTESTNGVNSNPDFTFLIGLAQAAAGDSTLLAAINAIQVSAITAEDIAGLAKTRWDEKVAKWGSTQEVEPNGTATTMAEQLRLVWAGSPAPAVWDMELAVEAALKLHEWYPAAGYDQQAVDIAAVIYNSVDDAGGLYFDSTDTTQTDFVLGLTGAIKAFTEVGQYPLKVEELTGKLLSYQQPDGSWNFYGATPATKSVQSTAYAVMALHAVGTVDALTAANKAAYWLVANQNLGGGWYAEGGAGNEIAEVDAEAARALATLPANVTIGTNEYYTIQSAIDSAAAGDTINVGAGTYVESGQIVIDKNLSIVGADKTTTIIKPGNDTVGDGDSGTFILVVNDITFNLSGVTIDGTGRQIRQAVRYNGGGVVNDVIIQNIAAPGYMGFGVVQGYTNTSPRSLTVSNSTFLNIGRVAIQADEGYAASTATFTNNVITGKGTGDHLDYGIYVEGGAAATISGNTITNCRGVASVDGSTSAAIAVGTYFAPGTTATITNNVLTDNSTGIAVGYDATDTSTVTAENNRIVTYDYAITSTNPAVDGSPNWFGSVSGPASGTIVGNVTYDPWCGDEACTFLLSNLPLTDFIAAAPSGGTLYVPTSPPAITGGFIINKPLTIVLADGVVINNDSPCFVVTSSNVTITTESIGGAVCTPDDGASGITVADGLADITINGLEIDGSATTGSNHGIEFLGASSYVRILNNYIHDMDQTGLFFAATPTGTVDIQGNLFKNNIGVGISNLGGTPSPIIADYNSWGSIDGPTAGDGVSANVTVTTWTHADLFMVSSGTPWADQVVPGEDITYTVKANLKNVVGAAFTLAYDPAVLDLVSTTAATASTFAAAGPQLITVDEIAGTVSFDGIATAPVSAADYALFDVTFNVIGSAGATPLAFDLLTDEFAMELLSGYTNNVYADALVGNTVTIINPPTISSSDFGGNFSVGFPRTFSLTVTNPVPSVIYPSLELRISLPADATLKVYNGSSFVAVTCTAGICTVPVVLTGGTATLQFEVTFNTAETPVISASLYETSTDPDWLLHTLAGSTTTVSANYTVTGMVTMQGRVFRGGVPALLTKLNLTVYGPFPATSLDIAPGNLVWTNIPVGQYLFTTSQPRYLNVTVDLGKTFTLGADYTMNSLELKGGDADDNAKIELADASIVGGKYGTGTIADNADVNFDGKVNIFDLALVGGNYNLTSATAYGTWTP